MGLGWKSYLQRLARIKGMCDDNRAYLSACETKADAIRLYKQTVDWALEEHYPDFEFIEKEFSDAEQEGVFVNKQFDGEILNEHQVYVFHKCSGTIRVGINRDKRIIPMLYFANGCKMVVEGIEDSRLLADRVPFYIFGENEVTPINSDKLDARIYVQKVKGRDEK